MIAFSPPVVVADLQFQFDGRASSLGDHVNVLELQTAVILKRYK